MGRSPIRPHLVPCTVVPWAPGLGSPVCHALMPLPVPLPWLTPCPVAGSCRPLSPASPLPAQPLYGRGSGIDHTDLQNGEPRAPSPAGTALGLSHCAELICAHPVSPGTAAASAFSHPRFCHFPQTPVLSGHRADVSCTELSGCRGGRRTEDERVSLVPRAEARHPEAGRSWLSGARG